MRQRSKARRWVPVLVLTLALVTVPAAMAQSKARIVCGLGTLQGLYIFDASGFNITNGTAVPKTVVEFLKLDGDGGLTSIATAVVGTVILASKAAGGGVYRVNDDCTGTLSFNNSPLAFDIYAAPDGKSFHMIQTAPSGQVLAGLVQKVDPDEGDGRKRHGMSSEE